MKKISILLSIIIFGVATSFAQVDKVNVSWDASNCFEGTCGAQSADYFKITVSIYDDANDKPVLPDITITAGINETDADVNVPHVDTYCNKSHDYTPSFTITATVVLMDTSTNPETECCFGSDDYSSYNCHQFYNATINLTPEIVLN